MEYFNPMHCMLCTNAWCQCVSKPFHSSLPAIAGAPLALLRIPADVLMSVTKRDVSKKLVQYVLGRLSWPDGCNQLLVINYRPNDIIHVTFSIPNFVDGRCAGYSEYVAKAGDWNHRLVVIWQFLRGLERRLQKFFCTQLVRVCLAPVLSVHLSWRHFLLIQKYPHHC